VIDRVLKDRKLKEEHRRLLDELDRLAAEWVEVKTSGQPTHEIDRKLEAKSRESRKVEKKMGHNQRRM
jgi:transcriptional regulator of NAD metabolism